MPDQRQLVPPEGDFPPDFFEEDLEEEIGESGPINVEPLLLDLYTIDKLLHTVEPKHLRAELQDCAQTLRARLNKLLERVGKDHAKYARNLKKFEKAIKNLKAEMGKLMAPPKSYGVFVGLNSAGEPMVKAHGRQLVVNCATKIDISKLQKGQEVELNEGLNIVRAEGFGRQGEVVKLKEVLESGKRLIVSMHADEERTVEVAGSLAGETFKAGDVLRLDPASGFVLERMQKKEVSYLLLEKVPNVTLAQIGGLKAQADELIEAIEWPIIHAQEYAAHKLTPPKGILVYGPPGCGKTLLAKAVANRLASQLRERMGNQNIEAYFFNIKGPELLDKYVGETERRIREIFQRARELAAQGHIVVIFFDEFESMFRTRGAGISSDIESTIVPQFLAEMDGVEELRNVVVIGATNRQDLIDPAILRPGRFDLKVKVERPSREAAYEIFGIYATPDLPWGEDSAGVPYVGQKVHAVIDRLRGNKEYTVDLSTPELMANHLIKVAIDYLYYDEPPVAWTDRRGNKHEWNAEQVELTWSDREKKKLYIKDLLVSGALIDSVVTRVKKASLKSFVLTGKRGITMSMLYAAIRDEIKQNSDLPNSNNPDDWAKILGQYSAEGARLTGVRPIIGTQTANKDKKVTVATTGHYL